MILIKEKNNVFKLYHKEITAPQKHNTCISLTWEYQSRLDIGYMYLVSMRINQGFWY